MKQDFFHLIIRLWLLLLAVSCSVSNDGKNSSSEMPAPIKRLIEDAYAQKKIGQNGAALSLLKDVARLLESTGKPDKIEVASNLDDQASINLRLGHYVLAKAQYQEAKAILQQRSPAEAKRDQLMSGIDFRLGILAALEKNGVQCDEPLARPNAIDPAALPYFPVIEEMQRALDLLGPGLAHCSDGSSRPVMVRLVITGQGKIVFAKVSGIEQGTPLAQCLEASLLTAAPKVELPRFAACFRQFNYPFHVGRS